MIDVVAPLIVGGAGGALASLFHVPVAWLLGSMIAGLAFSLASQKGYRVRTGLVRPAEAILGVAVGLTFNPASFGNLQGSLPAIGVTILFTAALSLGNGYLLARFAGVDPASGFLGSVPGAAAAMVAASDHVGADARVVAVLQYVRLVTILLLVPVSVSYAHSAMGLGSTEGIVALGPAPNLPPGPWGYLILAVLTGGGPLLGRLLRLPSPVVMGSLVAAVGATLLLEQPPAVPTFLFNGALGVIGTSVGLRFDVETLRGVGRPALLDVLLVLLLIVGSAALGFLLHLVTGMDLTTAVLGNVPGGMEGMIASAFQLDANAPVVAGMQMLRYMVMLVVGPWVAGRLYARVGGSPGTGVNRMAKTHPHP